MNISCTVHRGVNISMCCSQAWSTSEALPSATDISCTVHEPRALQKCSHQPLDVSVQYMSLEPLRSKSEEQGKIKSKHKGLSPDKSWGIFVQCQYRNQSVSTLCTREKQSISITTWHSAIYPCRCCCCCNGGGLSCARRSCVIKKP